MNRLYLHIGTNTQHHVCPCAGPVCTWTDEDMEKVDEAFSFEHATQLGWRKTEHPLFSQDGRPVIICPECVKKLGAL